MLCKLSLKNIHKSIKDYAIYFFTLILGVAIFYVFNAIDSQSAMLDISSRTYEILKLLTTVLSGVSVFVSIILAFLIIYATRFLMKRRNKEFAIYLTLGMSKRKISILLFLETLFIGIISLTIGLLVGVLLSQLMSILVASMFEANLGKFTFVFSKSAFMKTLLYFGITYLLVMIFNTISISKCHLIDLLYSSKKSEKIKLKNSLVCIMLFIVACGMLSYAYYLVTKGLDKITDYQQILIPIVLGALATFLIFFSLSGLLIKIFKRNKNFYYRKLNSFTIRQISSKINTTVFLMTVICLMLFVTICVLSSSLSMKNSLNSNLKNYAPCDIEFSKIRVSKEEIDDYSDEQKEYFKLNINQTLTKMGFDYKSYLKDIVNFSLYTDDNVTLKSSLGDYYNIVNKQYSFLRYNDNIYLMKNSDYNKMAKSFHLQKVNLDSNQYAVVGNYKTMLDIKNEALKRNTTIRIDSKDYYPKYQRAIHGFYVMTSNESEIGFIVLPDEALKTKKKVMSYMIANYKGDKEKVEEIITSLMQKEKFTDTHLAFNTKIDIKEAAVGIGALVTFIGLYLGVIFLISCAAILALKELSESSDNKVRFQMLRRIGVSEEELNKALLKQISIFFIFPLLLAVLHSVFGIMFCNIILKDAGISFDLKAVVMTSIFIIIIYGGYLVVTYLCSKNIIKENR